MSGEEKNTELLEDLELLARYRSSADQTDLMVLFKKYMGLIYGVCLKYLKNEEKSKDAVMDIYEKLVTKLLKHEVKNPKSWLYMVTKNHCYEILRNKSRVMEKQNDATLMYYDEVLRPYEEEEKENELLMLEECVDSLENRQQEAIRLFYLQKKTYKEVTGLMSVNWNQARSLIQNGRRNLKNCMEKKYESIREK